MNEKITKALNEQINKEMESAYLYLGMAVHFEAEALLGFAHWMQAQAKEEMEHALKIYRYPASSTRSCSSFCIRTAISTAEPRKVVSSLSCSSSVKVS